MISRLFVGLLWGTAHGWSISSPWSGQAVWWLQLIALTWLVRRLSAARSAQETLVIAYPFGIAWFASSMGWLFTSMHDYGGLAAPLAVLAVLALSAFLASFYAIACAVYARLKSHRPWQDALLFAALWLLAELLRGVVLSGFPWSAAGYAHIDGPLAALAPYTGVYGISFAAAWVAAQFVLTRSCLLKIAIVVILLLRTLHFAGEGANANTPQAALLLPSQGKQLASLSVRLLQGNIPQNEKFDRATGVDVALRWYQDALRQAALDGVDLVVAPETAIPLLPQQLPLGYWPELHDTFAKQTKTAALIGIPLGSMADGYTNSVIGLLPASGDAYRYDKHHLVPFGEFIPPAFRWFTDLLHIPLGDFARGDLAQPSMLHKGWRLAPNICYEDLFGEELATRFANPMTAPTLFVNVSNMGWFALPNASSMAIDQHLNISRMRALEFDRSMIRATNTGATVIINRKGVVTHSLARGTRGVLDGTVDGGALESGAGTITPYAHFASQYGLKPLWLLAFGLISLTLIRRK
jgi:apolipoprotein N-acyltransferase